MTHEGAAGQGAGRFAPSPTGPLHLGSLLAATASYLDARHHRLAWQVRLDDLDEPRHLPGAEAAILSALEHHGLDWDGPIVYQSARVERYQAALASLQNQRLLFYCRCSRKVLRGAKIYPGTCRHHTSPRADSALRIRVDDLPLTFDDLVDGPQTHHFGRDSGDFVVRRRDGIIAYQIATAVDDGAADISRVIRGRDLLATTAPQIYLMQRLGLDVPAYGHLPLLLNRAGQKLSKQTHAAPLDNHIAVENLSSVLRVLGLTPLPDAGDCVSLLADAIPRFSLEAVPHRDTRLDDAP